MQISFVILNWNSKQHIQKCINSIIENLNFEKIPYEILIVDNGSTDGSVEIINDYSINFPDIVKPFFLTKNTGTTFSRNLALKKTRGRYIAVIDSDVEIIKGIFEELIQVLLNNERIGIVAPRLVYGNGSLQKSTDNFPTIFSKVYRFFFLKRIEKKESFFCPNKICDVEYAISAFWFFNRKLIDIVGLLDEKIFYAPEDVDYCLRVWKQGYRIVYAPNVSAVHNAQEISRGLRINKATIEHVKGLFYFFKKHGYLLNKPTFF